MTLREAAQQALEALDSAQRHNYALKHKETDNLIFALRAALADATSQESRQVEPVAVWELQESGWEIICDGDWVKELPLGTKLYTAQPKRKPLTDEAIWLEYQTLWPFCPHEEKRLSADIVRFARTIERAHGIGGEE